MSDADRVLELFAEINPVPGTVAELTLPAKNVHREERRLWLARMVGKQQAAGTFAYFEVWFTTALLYLVLTLPLPISVAFIADLPSGFEDPATVLPVQIFLWNDAPERAFQAKMSAAIVVLLGVLVLMNATAVWLRNRFATRY